MYQESIRLTCQKINLGRRVQQNQDGILNKHQLSIIDTWEQHIRYNRDSEEFDWLFTQGVFNQLE
jgi:hypothetical protein